MPPEAEAVVAEEEAVVVAQVTNMMAKSLTLRWFTLRI